jgi:hypothetical protein
MKKRYYKINPDIFLKFSLRAPGVLLSGLILTFISVQHSQNKAKEEAVRDIKANGNKLKLNIKTRHKAHALLLRSGTTFFAASDTVTQKE